MGAQRSWTDTGFRAARRAGMGFAAPEVCITAPIAVNAALVALLLLSSTGDVEGWSGVGDALLAMAGSVALFVFMAALSGVVVIPVTALTLFRKPIVRWMRIAPTWRRAARREPTRVLHGVVLPERFSSGKDVVRTVRIDDADVLPVLHLSFVSGTGTDLAGTVALELFAGDDVGGPVRVTSGHGVLWAHDVAPAPPERLPEIEAEVELGGSPLDPDVSAWSVRLARSDGVHGVPLTPDGDGFDSARRVGAAGTGIGSIIGLTSIATLLPLGFHAFLIADALGPPGDSGGVLDMNVPWHLALALVLTSFPLVMLSVLRRQIRRRRLVRPTWRRAAANRPTTTLTGTMLPGTRVVTRMKDQTVGRYGARVVVLNRPVEQDGRLREALELLFVTAEGRGERLAGPVTVWLYADSLLRGPARVRDARRTEWALAARDVDAGPGTRPSGQDWDDDGWTDLSMTAGGPGESDSDDDGGGD